MSSLNKVQIIGNLGKPPELRYTQGGSAYCNISVATSDGWTDKSGQRHERTEWHRVTVWKKQAENVAKFCGKGSKVYVEGRLQTRSWDENGQKRYQTDVVAEEVKFLSSVRDESPPTTARGNSNQSTLDQGDFVPGDMSDEPF